MEPDGEEETAEKTTATAATKKKPGGATKKSAATQKPTNAVEKAADATKKTDTTTTTVGSPEKTPSSTNGTLVPSQNFAEGGSDALEGVRASQIDTSAVLFQRTMNKLFGTPSSSSGSDTELTQSAVVRAFDLTNLQLLSEVSGAESDAQPDTVLTDQHDSVSASQSGADSQRPIVPTPANTRVLRPRREVKKDVNFVPDDEALSEYESFSSGESDNDIEDNNDEDDFYSREDPDENDGLSEDDAVPMDAAFIKSLQVGDNALNKQATQQRENALRAMEGTPASHVFEENAPPYPGLHEEEAQPVLERRKLCHSPLLTFFYFMPKPLWVKITAETNRYGLQEVNRRAERIHAKQRDRRQETVKQISRRLKAKPGYETHEVLHVIGLLIARMLCPQKRRFAAHWSMVEDGAVPEDL